MAKMKPAAAQFFWSGVKAEFPLLVGVVPFGMIYGVSALSAGLTPAAAQAMSAVVFAGSAQFVTTQLVSLSVPGLVAILTIAVVNLRHGLYSVSIAPYTSRLSLPWKLGLSYLLTDEAYAVTITHYAQQEDIRNSHWFFLGSGLTLWTSWQISTAFGILLGTVVPASWSLEFALPLTFIALTIPFLKDSSSMVAALSAGITALLAYTLPLKLGLILAAFVGVLVGLIVENRK